MLDDLLSVPEAQIFQTVTSYAKIYPEMTKLIEFHNPAKVRIAGFEPRKKRSSARSGENSDPLLIIDSLRRTKTRLSDLVISNEFDLFCTFTFATDRENIDRCKQRMHYWLNNQSTRVGKFNYLIVPEFHPKALAEGRKEIHFHALFKGYSGLLVDSGHKNKAGKTVYNLPGYTHGFSTAVKIDDVKKVGSYVKKYITKDMPLLNNKKRYWVSQKLARPVKVTNPVVFPDQRLLFNSEYNLKNFDLLTASERIDLISASIKYKLSELPCKS